MNLKLIMALVSDEKTEAVLEAARKAGATGATTITSVRGEGLKREKTFLGLDLSSQRDVAAQKARDILETIAKAGQFESEPGAGIAFQIGIEDTVGLNTQLDTILHEIEDEI